MDIQPAGPVRAAIIAVERPARLHVVRGFVGQTLHQPPQPRRIRASGRRATSADLRFCPASGCESESLTVVRVRCGFERVKTPEIGIVLLPRIAGRQRQTATSESTASGSPASAASSFGTSRTSIGSTPRAGCRFAHPFGSAGNITQPVKLLDAYHRFGYILLLYSFISLSLQLKRYSNSVRYSYWNGEVGVGLFWG